MDEHEIGSSSALLDHAVQSSPFDLYRDLHLKSPISIIAELGIYVVSRYDDARLVLSDTERFSSDLGDSYFQVQGVEGARYYRSLLAAGGWDHVSTLQRTDPPAHSRYRRLVEKIFTMQRVKKLAPRIEEVCHELIDTFAALGRCDFYADFAVPLTGIIIAEQLGLDRREIGKFKRWADALVAPACRKMSREDLDANAVLELEMQHHLATLLQSPTLHTEDNIIGWLAAEARNDSDPLTMHEVQNLMHQLVSGGFETTASAIAHALWLLLRFPDQMDGLRRSPDLIRNFTDEALRYESPVQGLLRTVTRDTVFQGVAMPKGAHVMVRYAAANHDPAKFSCPHSFDIERSNAGTHLAFGSGSHFCVGRLLAKKELELAFSIVLERMKNIALDGPMPVPAHHPDLLLRPIMALKIRFSTSNS